MGAPESNTTNIYGIHLRESADDGSDFSNAAADYRVLFLGEDGQLHVKDSSGTVTDPFTAGGGSGQGLVDFGTARRTAGDVTCSADSVWTEIDSGIRITVTAAIGDRLEIGIQANCTGTEAVSLNLTAMSMVGGAAVNDLFEGAAKSDSTNGAPGWRMVGSVADHSAGSFISPALVSGDLTTTTCIVGLFYRTSSSTNRVLRADTTLPLEWHVKNLGAAI